MYFAGKFYGRTVTINLAINFSTYNSFTRAIKRATCFIIALLFVLRACYRARLFDGCTYASDSAASFQQLGTCLKLHSTDRTSYEAHRLRPIQKQLNLQFRPLRVSGKRLRTRGCACRICIHA